MRSSDRDVWQEAEYSAPSGAPRETKGANHDNVLSKMFKSINDVQISVTYFGGGPVERYQVDGDSVPTDWHTGQPKTDADYIVCSQIQVVYGGVQHHLAERLRQTTFCASPSRRASAETDEMACFCTSRYVVGERRDSQRGRPSSRSPASVSRICSVPPAIVRQRVLRKSCTPRSSTMPAPSDESIRNSASACR